MKYIVTLFFLTAVTALVAQNTLPESKAQAAAKSSASADRVPVETSIAVADSGVQRLIVWLNEWDDRVKKEEGLGKADPERTSNLNLSKSNRTSFNSSRSNLYRLSAALNKLKRNELHDRDKVLRDMRNALEGLEQPVRELYDSILARGEKFASDAAELKTRHDTVKNSISNIR